MEKFLIVDIPMTEQSISQLFGFGLTVLVADLMTNQLLAFDIWQTLPRVSTLLVFPGRGAKYVRKTLPDSWLAQWSWTSVYAKRDWQPGQSPLVIVGHIFPDGLHLEWTDIIVVDDVVSSGLTCKKLMAVNGLWFPRAQWHVVTWVRQRAGSLRGIRTTQAVYEVGTKETKTSVQSLSTLLLDQEIAAGYLKKQIIDEDKARFLVLLEELRINAGAT